MKTTEWARLALYEGLDKEATSSMMLWESAGHALVEAQLTAQQITTLFQQIEQGATAAGDNRTLLGKGKDLSGKALTAVNTAYKDLVNKAQNSNTMQFFDQQYDQAAEKLKQATGGDQGVMQYVQKYRDFAKKHPVAQTLIYGALIAAAGISGAGAGGAAALGLLKMTDRLLQGDKFSSALGKGLKTGAIAYGVGQAGKALQTQTTTTTSPTISQGGQGYMIANQPVIPGQPLSQEQLSVMKMAIASGNRYPPEVMTQYAKQVGGASESRAIKGSPLTEEFVLSLFRRVARINSRMIAEGQLIDRDQLNEGLFDKFKTGAAKVAGDVGKFAGGAAKAVGKDIAAGAKAAGGALAKGAKAVGSKVGQAGHNLTTKVTADKLTKAWKAAGSPTDSAAVEKVLQDAGVSPEVVDTVFKANGVPVTLNPAEQPQGQTDGGQAPQPIGGTVLTPTPINTSQKTAAGGLDGVLPDISNLTQPQLRQLLPKIDARIAEIGAQPQQGKQPSKQTQAPAVNPGTKVTVTGDNGKPAEYTRTSKGWVNSQTLKPIDPGSAAEEYLDAQSANPTDPAGKQPVKKTAKPKVKYQDQTFAKTNQPKKPAANQQSAVDTKMSTNPVNQPTTQTATADTMKAAQPKKTTATTQPLKVSAQRNSGLPTSDEMVKYQEKLKAAMAAQDKQQGVF